MSHDDIQTSFQDEEELLSAAGDFIFTPPAKDNKPHKRPIKRTAPVVPTQSIPYKKGERTVREMFGPSESPAEQIRRKTPDRSDKEEEEEEEENEPKKLKEPRLLKRKESTPPPSEPAAKKPETPARVIEAAKQAVVIRDHPYNFTAISIAQPVKFPGPYSRSYILDKSGTAVLLVTPSARVPVVVDKPSPQATNYTISFSLDSVYHANFLESVRSIEDACAEFLLRNQRLLPRVDEPWTKPEIKKSIIKPSVKKSEPKEKPDKDKQKKTYEPSFWFNCSIYTQDDMLVLRVKDETEDQGPVDLDPETLKEKKGYNASGLVQPYCLRIKNDGREASILWQIHQLKLVPGAAREIGLEIPQTDIEF